MADEKIRLQKYLAECGIASRRKSEELIAAGKVKVNGVTASIGDKVNPKHDKVTVSGKKAVSVKKSVYIMLNKPRGFITTMSDEHDRKCVAELVKGINTRVYPVGRLDRESEGLLIMTNDGEFANLLTHPKHDIPKIYLVKVSGQVADTQLKKLTSPMTIDGYRLEPVGCTIESVTETSTVLRFTLHEGRNRQIRKMCEKVGLRILRLKRIAIGKVELGELPGGKWRMLTPAEVKKLMDAAERTADDGHAVAGRGGVRR